MNTRYETSFTIMPDQCNYMFPMVFGGAFFSQLDLAAACAVNRLLHDSECNSAVTHKYSGTFHAAAECGDIIFVKAEIIDVRHKSVVVNVRAEREKRAKPGRDLVATADFVFVTKKDGEFHNHGISIEDLNEDSMHK